MGPSPYVGHESVTSNERFVSRVLPLFKRQTKEVGELLPAMYAGVQYVDGVQRTTSMRRRLLLDCKGVAGFLVPENPTE